MNALDAEGNGIKGSTVERAGRGPLFIVGLPRSGTKLIRDLLNRSPEIGIPVEESHFIPYFIAKFGAVPEPGNQMWRERFMRDLRRTPFFQNYARAGRSVPDDLLAHPPLPEEWPAAAPQGAPFDQAPVSGRLGVPPDQEPVSAPQAGLPDQVQVSGRQEALPDQVQVSVQQGAPPDLVQVSGP